MSLKKLSFETRLLVLCLLSSVPSAVALIFMMLNTGVSVYLTAIIGLLLALIIAWCVATITTKTSFLFRTLSNLLEAMTKGDYSLRGRKEYTDSALDNLVAQINTLSETLARQRLEVKEHQLLLSKVINHIDVAIVATNEHNQITLTNPAATKLLADKALSSLDSLEKSGKYNIVKDQFIEEGQKHHLLFITDVRDLLRAQERKAWQNLIRVLSHEINNSLTPIASISQTLHGLVKTSDQAAQDKEDITDGLLLINERAKSLRSFIDSYRNLSRLPQPKKHLTVIKPLLDKVLNLFEQTKIDLICPDDLAVTLDPIQMEQLLINLIKNAIEAMAAKPGNVTIKVVEHNAKITLMIKDQGPGLTNPDNLFVPFYTTKAKGSGTGLVLSRQIIEAHGGDLILQNASDETGCEVLVELPR